MARLGGCYLDSELNTCPELNPDVPRVEEKHKSHTKVYGLHLARDGIRECDQGCGELSWTTAKVNVNINTTNERERKGWDLY